jgi:hypothetical protein
MTFTTKGSMRLEVWSTETRNARLTRLMAFSVTKELLSRIANCDRLNFDSLCNLNLSFLLRKQLLFSWEIKRLMKDTMNRLSLQSFGSFVPEMHLSLRCWDYATRRTTWRNEGKMMLLLQIKLERVMLFTVNWKGNSWPLRGNHESLINVKRFWNRNELFEGYVDFGCCWRRDDDDCLSLSLLRVFFKFLSPSLSSSGMIETTEDTRQERWEKWQNKSLKNQRGESQSRQQIQTSKSLLFLIILIIIWNGTRRRMN